MPQSNNLLVALSKWASGIQQFQNFKVLLKQAMESAGAEKVWSAYGADFNGWAIPDKEQGKSTFYSFIRFEKPTVLQFLCGQEYVLDQYRHDWAVDSWNKRSLRKTLDLDSEEVHFFSRGLDSQRVVLEEFVSSCLGQTTY